ncbi:MAG TPA: proton-conducting transporter membrane subunit, partial [Elusimicrobiales bacterium]|nr:proton-conducting transporter membrane subunit [Elusimicrobiales bacterium]
MWLTLAVAIPVLGSLLVALFGANNPAVARRTAVILGLATLFSVLKLVLLDAGASPVEVLVQLPLGFDFHLQADYLAVFMALVSSSISFIIILYSLGYMQHYKHQPEYFLMVVLFLGGMMGLVFSVSLVWLFVFWEITALCSWRLVGFFRGEREILKANKTFLVTAFGALCLLLGIVAVYCATGTVDMLSLRGQLLPGYVVALFLLGIFSKSATLPLSTWLPDAGVAPSPVTALLHAAVLVKIGVYAYARLFLVTFQIGTEWNTIVAIVAGVSALISAGAALTETDIKRIIAYSTISQIGFIFLGLAT